MRGVTVTDRGKFKARVYHNGKCYECGTFTTLDAAAAAARAKRLELFTYNDLDRQAV
jgi:hypothetical protein